jgi:hypothetical protein
MENDTFETLKKRKNVIDMMTSMHSELSRKYRNRSLALDIIVVSFSILLLSSVFIDPDLLSEMGIDANILKLIIGICTISITILSILSYVIDWRGKKIAHEHAFTSLVSLKDEWRLFLFDRENVAVEKMLQLEEKTTLIMHQLITIDDPRFNTLKRKHYMKVELSKITTKYPFIPLFILRFFCMIKDLKIFLRSQKESKGEIRGV